MPLIISCGGPPATCRGIGTMPHLTWAINAIALPGFLPISSASFCASAAWFGQSAVDGRSPGPSVPSFFATISADTDVSRVSMCVFSLKRSASNACRRARIASSVVRRPVRRLGGDVELVAQLPRWPADNLLVLQLVRGATSSRSGRFCPDRAGGIGTIIGTIEIGRDGSPGALGLTEATSSVSGVVADGPAGE